MQMLQLMMHTTQQSTYNPDVPNYVPHIKNKLFIQGRQIYITFNKNAADSPKKCGGAAAYALYRNMNEWVHSLDQEIDQVS